MGSKMRGKDAGEGPQTIRLPRLVQNGGSISFLTPKLGDCLDPRAQKQYDLAHSHQGDIFTAPLAHKAFCRDELTPSEPDASLNSGPLEALSSKALDVDQLQPIPHHGLAASIELHRGKGRRASHRANAAVH